MDISTEFAPLSKKFVVKYMRLAKLVGEDQNPCYSRQIGTVLVKVYDDGSSRIIATGYNGPPERYAALRQPRISRAGGLATAERQRQNQRVHAGRA
jgi:deoxycytidylate deaminase